MKIGCLVLPIGLLLKVSPSTFKWILLIGWITSFNSFILHSTSAAKVDGLLNVIVVMTLSLNKPQLIKCRISIMLTCLMYLGFGNEDPYFAWAIAPKQFSYCVCTIKLLLHLRLIGIEVNSRKMARESDEGCRPPRKVNRTPLPPRELAAAVVTHNSEGAELHASIAAAVDDGYEEEQLQPVSCGTGHKHPGRTYADTDINVSVDALFACLFTDSQFFASFCTHRGTFDVEQSRWPPKPWPEPITGDATINRKISYVLTLKQRLGPRTCRAFESQVSRRC